MQKWVMCGDEYTEAWKVAQEITDNMADWYYDDMLNDVYGEVSICGYTYQAAEALADIDPVAYRCGRSDYYSSLEEDIRYDLERMSDGETQTFYEFEVECVDQDEEDEEEYEDEAC